MQIGPDILPLVGAGGVFLVIMAVVVLLGRRGANEPDVGNRLNQFAGREARAVEREDAKALAKLDAAVAKGKRGSQIARNLARADLKLTVTEFIGIKILAALVGAGVGAFIGRASIQAQVVSALVGALVLSFGPDFYVGFAAKRRIKAFNNQLGDAISMLANSLRSGYSFLQSMELVSREAPIPTSNEFRRVVQEVGLGLSTETALDNLLKRVPSDDLDLLITAVNIQHEVGGNLAQILETIGHTIRERVRIKGEIQTLTAQGRMSGYVITLLPIGLAVVITMMNPEYMSPMFKFGFPPDAWCCLPVASLILIAIGYFAIMKIVDIEV
ncbi:MAG TPA: type II secretion system F family protein [Roseiflexaceae bacterium]|nr:type II secretion system F family protein [Roseiflexaceae bacterium]